MTNYGPDKMLDLNTSFERYLSKLSEYNKNVDIGSSELKLWPFKRCFFNATCRYTPTSFEWLCN